MRDTWQALAMNRTANKCSVALESYMRLLRVDRPREVLKAMMSDQLSPEQQETLDRKLTWASWNIVEGPSFRTDDPEDAFDEFTAGLTESERSRQQRIKSLFLELQIFNSATGGSKFSESAAAGVTSAMNTVERRLLSGDVIFFRAEMWTESKPPDSKATSLGQVKYWRKRPGRSSFDRAAAKS
jgi:hypothetical protein